jgi:hypothetical protein
MLCPSRYSWSAEGRKEKGAEGREKRAKSKAKGVCSAVVESQGVQNSGGANCWMKK